MLSISTSVRAAATALIFGISAIAQDECASAGVIVNGANGPFSNVGATATAVPGTPTCATGSWDQDIWFLYSASCTGTATFQTCAMTGGEDTVLAVYDGTGGCGALTQLGCNDDSCGVLSAVSVPVTSGGLYYLRVDLFGTAVTSAAISIDVSCSGPAANDECAGAILVLPGTNGPFSNIAATDSTVSTGAPAASCEPTSFDQDVWFMTVAPCNGNLTIETCAAGSGDTVIEVYNGTGGCAALVSVGCNDQACGNRSRVTVASVTAGTVYYIRLDTWQVATLTNMTIDVICAPPVANDECTGALPLAYGLNAGLSNVGSTASAPAAPCSFNASPVADLWYTYTATCTAPHTFSTCTTTLDTVIELFDNCTLLTSLGCNDDSCGLRSSLTVSLTSGTTYLLRAGGWNGAVGTFDVTVVTGTNTGSQTLNLATTCGAGLGITVTPGPIPGLNIGGSLTINMTGATGNPVVGYGFLPHFVMPCGCSVVTGGDGLLGTLTFFLGTTALIPIPCDPTLVGLTGMVQGIDLFFPAGSNPPCTIPTFADIRVTDIIAVTLG